MEVFDFDKMEKGWFIGNFEPTAFKTEEFEVCYKEHKKGEKWETHYHKKGTEVNFLIRGHMKIQGRILYGGDIFVIPPYEIADPEFLEDCILVIVKTPSKQGDKYEIDIKK